MSHGITLEERFVISREPAWHNLGHVFTETLSVEQAMAKAKLFFNVYKIPLFAHIAEIDGSSEPLQINRMALMREPLPEQDEWQLFGVVTDSYGLLDNKEIAAYLDPLSEKWPVECAGTLWDGRKTFIVLNAGMTDIKGEEIKMYFVFVDDKTGHHKAQFLLTDIRIVCQNTLNYGTARATINAEMIHHDEISVELAWKSKMLNKLADAQSSIIADNNALAERKLNVNQIKAIIEKAYPPPKQSRRLQVIGSLTAKDKKELSEYITDEEYLINRYDNKVARFEDKREMALLNVERVSDLSPQIGKTAWAVYNAIVECEDFIGPDNESTRNSALFGARARVKNRAYTAALKTL